MSVQHDSSTQLLRVSSEYSGLLNELETTTVGLIAAIGAWDSDKVGELIEARAALCDRIGESVRTLTTLGADQRPMSQEMEEHMQRVHDKGEAVLAQQAEAERVLAYELRSRRRTLAQMNENMDQQGAYRARSAVSYGRFLDSRT